MFKILRQSGSAAAGAATDHPAAEREGKRAAALEEERARLAARVAELEAERTRLAVELEQRPTPGSAPGGRLTAGGVGAELGVAEAVAAERARIGAILTAAEAEGRAALAQHLALQTRMDAEEARTLLAASPLEPANDPSGFERAMARAGNFDIGVDYDPPGDGAEATVRRIQAAAASVAGKK